ncbi:Lrp/AsnC family transcriptional regulator [Bradyrhizobium jicamae]|uniref:Lrp/AsnC family transcriptional regulator n=1 Tax=Bradyrhizobium jicamae TaxID=280332 RepID=A0ABS5FW00_9BRAD|nr:Lrp/AsnC family transcriptional regulator [Bradyrhizobium jicamae]MBR0801034.1 Lrp/AsnC family transcriptional regulator [Bradyrhizobium jicamae]MBR0939268.1 Lrp/AsnC family transcriptional regulator [Bradyrhizobium jicamae]
MSIDLDSIDRAILKTLQQNGRIRNNELAERVGLSPPPCLRRVRLLEEAGVIERYVALVDPAKVGMGLALSARVWLTGQDNETFDTFVEAIRRLPQIVECHLVAGDCDFLLKVVAKDLEAYRRFQIEELASIEGVRGIKAAVLMQRIKRSHEIPV